MIRPLRLALTALALLAATSAARADYLAGITYFGNQLVRIDPTTGAGSLIGNIGVNTSGFGLAQRGNALYTYDSNASVLRQINLATGASAGTVSIGVGPVLGQGGLAFRADGIGFLTSALNPSTFTPENNVYRFDVTTGTSTLIGRSAATLAGLAFVGNTLYGIGKNDDTLYTVNQATGSLASIGFLGAGAGSPIQSLTSGPNGRLFATFDDRLFTINTATGAATAVDPNPANDTGFSSISGLTFVSTSAVPEPGSLALLGIGLVGLAGLAARPRLARS